jgi:hypothetical protein
MYLAGVALKPLDYIYSYTLLLISLVGSQCLQRVAAEIIFWTTACIHVHKQADVHCVAHGRHHLRLLEREYVMAVSFRYLQVSTRIWRIARFPDSTAALVLPE